MGENLNRGVFRAKNPTGNIVGHNEIEILPRHLVPGLPGQIFGLRGESYQDLMLFDLAQERKNILCGRQSPGRLLLALLYFLVRVIGGSVIGDRGRFNHNVCFRV